ncbi:cysteine-rich receptor-like protein kinase 10 [Spinacia oleracea]|uniref:Cysteine-rich receptor-like protein kinase 10 n=1 Tax=Spinacia oleracea TaxID=3562 RepID=A0A9R0INI4_SPIOL|nr:cysteine-rich receptor-like protein kinase 10 [Spinacia oleracea]
MAIFVFSTNFRLGLFIAISFILNINSQEFRQCYEVDGIYNFHRNNSRHNIDKAITQLVSNATNTYFNTISTGSGLDKFNALYSCRYDYPLQSCHSCVKSFVDVVLSCLPNVQGHSYRDECTLYYSNRSLDLSDEMDKFRRVGLAGGRTVTSKEENKLSQTLYTTVTRLIEEVISEFNVSSRYFAMTSEKYSSSETIYALAQCNPDLTSFECKTCLQSSFDWFTSDRTFPGVAQAKIYTPICRLFYMFSNKELSQPWNFAISSTGTRGNPIMAAIVASTSSVALLLKLLL